MISTHTLASAPAIDLKKTRPLPLSKTPSIEFGQSPKQQLPYSNPKQNPEQRLLNQHLDQVIEQQISQVTDNPTETHEYKPLAVANPPVEPLLELLDLDETINPRPTFHAYKPLALAQNKGSNQANEQHPSQPFALAEKSSSLDIQLLTEHSSALLIDPAEQFKIILQNLLKTTPQVNPLYWIENSPALAATQVASATSTPNLAWQESLWF